MSPEKKTIKKSVTEKKKAVKKLKEPAVPVQAKKEPLSAAEEKPAPKLSYYFAVGRRKRAVAQVRLYKNGKGDFKVNNRDFRDYFPVLELQQTSLAPLLAVGQMDKLDVMATVTGGGIRGQAEAVRHGVSRALLFLNPVFRRSLKKVGFLTRDPREKERKKYGRKRARRAPQWAKR